MNAGEQKGYLYNQYCDPDVLRAQQIGKVFFFFQMLCTFRYKDMVRLCYFTVLQDCVTDY